MRPLVTLPAHADKQSGSPAGPWLRNYLLNWAEMLGGRVTLDSTPSALQFDTSDRCHTLCLMCPRNVSHPSPDRDWQELFGQLSPLLPNLCQLDLGIEGEPLLSERFGQVLRAVPPRVTLYVTTSLQLLTAEHLALLRTRKGVVCVSLDAANERTYRLIRNHDLQEVLNNIRELQEHSALGLFLSMIVMKLNLPELPDFFDLAEQLGASTVVLRRLLPGLQYQVERQGRLFNYADNELGSAELARVREACRRRKFAFRLLDFNTRLHIRSARAMRRDLGRVLFSLDYGAVAHKASSLSLRPGLLCTRPWQRLLIHMNGDVKVCCNHAPLGNLFQTPLSRIWNDPPVQEMRRELLDGKFPERCRGCLLQKDRTFCSKA